jgi:hypothetical protein
VASLPTRRVLLCRCAAGVQIVNLSAAGSARQNRRGSIVPANCRSTGLIDLVQVLRNCTALARRQ